MKRVICAAFCLLVIFSSTAIVFAKGATTKITITGAGLRSQVEISDPEVLKSFSVWSGPGTFANGVEGTEGFIVDWASGAVTKRPNVLRTFELSFYVRYANRPFSEQTDQLAYIVSYAVDPYTGQGYVYLPGKSDEPYRLNTKAIYRGREGNWFLANSAWQTVFRNLIQGWRSRLLGGLQDADRRWTKRGTLRWRGTTRVAPRRCWTTGESRAGECSRDAAGQRGRLLSGSIRKT